MDRPSLCNPCGGHEETVRLLIRAATTDSSCIVDDEGNVEEEFKYALNHAITVGNINNIVRQLILSGAALAPANLAAALDVANREGCTDISDLLVSAARKEPWYTGNPFDLLDAIYTSAVDPRDDPHVNPTSAIIVGISECRKLLAIGINVDEQDDDGTTAVIVCVRNKQ